MSWTWKTSCWKTQEEAHKKHGQPTPQFRKVCFVKDAKRQTKKCNISAKEVKDLNTFVTDKIDKTIKENECNMHAISDFKELSISSSNKSIQ
eukprot:4878492-Ditylum_brightwellii.AAC.1